MKKLNLIKFIITLLSVIIILIIYVNLYKFNMNNNIYNNLMYTDTIQKKYNKIYIYRKI